MKLPKTLFLHGMIVLAMLAVGLYLYPQLPDMVPTHWNIEGEPDSFSHKNFAVFFFPALTAGIAILFPIFAKIDPRKKRYTQFKKAWFMIRTVILACFAYLYFVSLYAAMNPAVDVGLFVLCGIAVMLILMGNYLGKVRQNYFLGIRTPWTLDNEEVWNKTHRVSGWMFVIAGVLLLLNAFLGIFMDQIILGFLIVFLLVPIAYSYLLHRKLTK